MAGLFDFQDRQVVPLWRDFGETMARGELTPVRPQQLRIPTEADVADLVHDWDRSRDVSIAADLVSVAWNLNLKTVALDAAEFVHRSDASPQLARSLAAAYLERGGRTVQPPRESPRGMAVDRPTFSYEVGAYHAQIREIRSRLSHYPRNAILYSQLSRLYTILGLKDKAFRAMSLALILAPDNRFVLRAASRMYLHFKEGDRAHRVLAGAGSLKFDPWVLSAEVATAAAINKTSQHVKLSRKLIDSGAHPPFQLSELASAVGTMEAKAGKRKSSRRFVATSMQRPTENSLAQADWLSRYVGFIDGVVVEHTVSPEANAWFAVSSSDWDGALREAQSWQLAQPFSSRPAILGSHLAGEVKGDYDLAIRIAALGLKSNPDDVTLVNNRAFFLASKGRLDEARAELSGVSLAADPEKRLVLAATQGFIAYRSEDPTQGRSLYNQAILAAERTGDWGREARARIYLARESIRSGEPDCEQLRVEAIAKAVVLKDPTLNFLIQRLNAVVPSPPLPRLRPE